MTLADGGRGWSFPEDPACIRDDLAPSSRSRDSEGATVAADEWTRTALEQVLPWGWTLDDVKPIVGSHWQVELTDTRGQQDVRVSISSASFAAILEAIRTCAAVSGLADKVPAQATLEIFVASRGGA